jgi:hypothetical protein
MKRPIPPIELTAVFFNAACQRHGRVDWLKPFDETDSRANGRLEATHLISRTRIANTLKPQLLGTTYDEDLTPLDRADVDDLVQIAEWDSRNAGGLAYTARHRRFDNQATPALRVPAEALPADFLEFVDDWGFEIEACRRFENFDTVVLGAGVPSPRGSGVGAPAPFESASAEQDDEARAA